MNAHQRRLSRRAIVERYVAELRAKEDLLPEGVWDDEDGRYWAECRGCRRDIDLTHADLSRFEICNFYCGGSPWCIP